MSTGEGVPGHAAGASGPAWALETVHPPRTLFTTQACCSEQAGLQMQTEGWKQSCSLTAPHTKESILLLENSYKLP